MTQAALRTTELSAEELARLGQRIYDRDLRHKLEPEHIGEYVVIHVANGDYAVGPDKHRSLAAMQQKYPDDVFFFARVGRRAAIRLRGLPTR